MAKTAWWRLPYVQPLLVASLIWGGGATWWYVCTTEQICEAQPTNTVASAGGSSVSVGTAASADEVVAQPPATLEAYYLPDSTEQAQAPDYTQIIEYLKSDPTSTVAVTGYFADVPSDVVGSDLSKARADYVKSQLIEQGVESIRITTQSKGADPSLNPNDEASLAHARRAEITIEKE